MHTPFYHLYCIAALLEFLLVKCSHVQSPETVFYGHHNILPVERSNNVNIQHIQNINKNSGSRNLLSFNTQNKRDILNYVNTHRSETARFGTTSPTPSPTAANMNFLFWDATLENVAQAHTDACTWSNPSLQSIFDANQPLYSDWSLSPSTTHLFQFMGITSVYQITNINYLLALIGEYYFDENGYIDTYQYEPYDLYGPMKSSDAFVGFAWAQTRYIGCAYTSCLSGTNIPTTYNDGTGFTLFMCLMYDSQKHNQLPWIAGKPCSQCDGDKTECWNGLCAYCMTSDWYTNGGLSGDRCIDASLGIDYSSKTSSPTLYPTKAPTKTTSHPTNDPTIHPTKNPTEVPTKDPTENPTLDPTDDPTMDPTIYPTDDPTTDPTIYPTVAPSVGPTIEPTISSTMQPDKSVIDETIALEIDIINNGKNIIIDDIVDNIDETANVYFNTLFVDIKYKLDVDYIRIDSTELIVNIVIATMDGDVINITSRDIQIFKDKAQQSLDMEFGSNVVEITNNINIPKEEEISSFETSKKAELTQVPISNTSMGINWMIVIVMIIICVILLCVVILLIFICYRKRKGNMYKNEKHEKHEQFTFQIPMHPLNHSNISTNSNQSNQTNLMRVASESVNGLSITGETQHYHDNDIEPEVEGLNDMITAGNMIICDDNNSDINNDNDVDTGYTDTGGEISGIGGGDINNDTKLVKQDTLDTFSSNSIDKNISITPITPYGDNGDV